MIRSILICILSSFLLLKTCSRQDDGYLGEKGVMSYGMDGIYHMSSLDSLIKADTLPSLEEWFNNGFRDYENNTVVITEKFIVKGRAVYVVFPLEGNDSVRIRKRILEVDL